MLAYYHMALQKEEEETSSSQTKIKIEKSFEQNKTLHKLYHSHRDMNIIDGTFIERVMRETIGVKMEPSPQNMVTLNTPTTLNVPKV